jgi:membrane associated rhomboid family serine protease
MNFCYRHPDREAYVRCQRCERFICPACQTEAAVGFLCPDDSGRSAVNATVTKLMPRRARIALGRGAPVATISIMAICALVFAAQLLIPGVTQNFAYLPLATEYEPWRMVTSMFLHSPVDFMHILLNMWSLWAVGRVLEYLLGARRFIWLYLLAGFGGSVGVLLLADPSTVVIGASGAIFGLMGAYFAVMRGMGNASTSMGAVVALNLVAGFLIPNVAWQAHVGGLLVGLLVGFIYSRTRSVSAGKLQTVYLILVGLGLVALTMVGIAKIGLGF